MQPDGTGMVAFEIDNICISTRTIAQLLANARGVTEIQKGANLDGYEGVHITFRYRGEYCVVQEPFGDKSRNWIGPIKSATSSAVDLSDLERIFRSHRPSFLR